MSTKLRIENTKANKIDFNQLVDDANKIDFNQLVDDATRYAHSELLKEGGKGLRSAIFLYMSTAINYSKKEGYKNG
jgi:geranylgeranyl pyrophosphate synthase